MRFLRTLKAGTRFRLAEMPEVTGMLIRVNECRAVVRLDRGEREVEFQDQHGEVRRFQSRKGNVTSWAPTTLVDAIGFEELKETTMSTTTTKSTKAAKAKGTKTAKAPKAKKDKKADGKLSCLDAAAQVLSETKEAMTTKALIEAMAAKGYWTSPGGQTPAATLYSALLREIQTKGKESRFKKADRGLFALNG